MTYQTAIETAIKCKTRTEFINLGNKLKNDYIVNFGKSDNLHVTFMNLNDLWVSIRPDSDYRQIKIKYNSGSVTVEKIKNLNN